MNPPEGRTRIVSKSATILAAFSVDHAARVTGISKARLTRWDKLEFFSPEYLDEDDRGNPYSRVYSFSDLVGLRTLAILTDVHRVPIPELRKAATELKKRADKPWAEIPLAVLKRKVVFDLDTKPRDTEGQLALKHIPLPTIASEVRAKSIELRKRDNNQIGVIERHKFIAHNAPVMAGTRIPVRAIESFVRAGFSDAAIVKEYPSLTTFDVSVIRGRMTVAA